MFVREILVKVYAFFFVVIVILALFPFSYIVSTAETPTLLIINLFAKVIA